MAVLDCSESILFRVFLNDIFFFKIKDCFLLFLLFLFLILLTLYLNQYLDFYYLLKVFSLVYFLFLLRLFLLALLI
jgi:hypothetical protein